MKLTNETRAALKSLIAKHPAWDRYRRDVLGGMNTGGMNKQQLLDTAAAFNIDVERVAGDVASGVWQAEQEKIAQEKSAMAAVAILGDTGAQAAQISIDVSDTQAAAAIANAAQAAYDTVFIETGDKNAARNAASVAADRASKAASVAADRANKAASVAADNGSNASETPNLDSAIAKARDVLDSFTPFLGDKIKTPLADAISHLAIAARDEIANVIPLPVNPGAAPHAKPQHLAKVGDLFAVSDASLKRRQIRVWDAKDAPRPDRNFAFVDSLLEDMLVAIERQDTIWLAGPKGTGKTSLPREIAARTNRPCVRIAHHRTTEPVELIGSMYPSADGGVEWKDGVLTAAIRKPGTIIILDEPTFCRAGVLALYQTLLDHRFLTLAENSGEVVPVAQGVVFIIADNTAGNGDDTGRYSDTNTMNAAFLDRAAKILRVDYLPSDKETELLANKTGIAIDIARMIVDFANVTRKAGEQGDISEGISFRRMVALANDLIDGISARRAFRNCVLNHATADDAVALNELAKAHLDFKKLNNGQPMPSDSAAAQQFDSVSL